MDQILKFILVLLVSINHSLLKSFDLLIFGLFLEKLEVSPADVKGAVEALSFVFAECAKSNITELDFLDTLLVLAFPQEINEGLKNVCL